MYENVLFQFEFGMMGAVADTIRVRENYHPPANLEILQFC